MSKKPEYVVDMGELDWTPEERRQARRIRTRSPAEVAKALDQAYKNFRAAYPDIPEEEALKQWKAAGG